MASIDIYADAAGTTLKAMPIHLFQDDQGILVPVQDRGFVISLDPAGTVFEADSDPGVDPILLGVRSIATGQPVSSIKIASTQGGLATAVAGDPLSLGTVFQSGVSNGLEYWMEWDDTTAVADTYDNLELYLTPLRVTLP